MSLKGKEFSSGVHKGALLLLQNTNYVVSLLESLFSASQMHSIEVLQKLTRKKDKFKWSKVLQFRPYFFFFLKTSKSPPLMSVKWLRSECCMRNKRVLFIFSFTDNVGDSCRQPVCLHPVSVNSIQSKVVLFAFFGKSFWTKQPLSLEHHSMCPCMFCWCFCCYQWATIHQWVIMQWISG